MTTIALPPIADNVDSGEIVKILVKVGEQIPKDHVVMEVETGKATVEIPAPEAGIVGEIAVALGQTVKVGQTLLTLNSNGAVAKAAPENVAVPATTSAKVAPVAPAVVAERMVAPQAAIEAQIATAVHLPTPNGALVPAAPSVRRLARELGMDVRLVRGSGERGRISIDDVKEHAKKLLSGGAQVVGGGVVTHKPLPDFSKWGGVATEPMNGIRKATAENMGVAWSTIPHVTQFDAVDITDLEALRKRHAPKLKAQGANLTLTAILLKICSAALKQFPKFGCSIDLTKKEIVYKHYCHIGVAVDTEAGLVVPVIRDVDKKNIATLSLDLATVSQKARDRKLKLEDMEGATFTISNLGGIGGKHFTPIINPPQVAILGVAKASMEPVWNEERSVFEPRLMVPLALSYDHRIIDGADGARFMNWIGAALKDPFVLALEG